MFNPRGFWGCSFCGLLVVTVFSIDSVGILWSGSVFSV